MATAQCGEPDPPLLLPPVSVDCSDGGQQKWKLKLPDQQRTSPVGPFVTSQQRGAVYSPDQHSALPALVGRAGESPHLDVKSKVPSRLTWMVDGGDAGVASYTCGTPITPRPHIVPELLQWPPGTRSGSAHSGHTARPLVESQSPAQIHSFLLSPHAARR